jgi:flavin-dependent dehydrogenase
MLSADIIVAGAGVAGLLIASALSWNHSVILLEQCASIPQNKYWLTDGKVLNENSQFEGCIDRRFNSLDFVSFDGLTARVGGSYLLWDTEKLLGKLIQDGANRGVQILTGHRLYSYFQSADGIFVRAGNQTIKARVLIDCMGYASPLAGAQDIATILGYYILHGYEVRIKEGVDPIALDNVIIDRHPTYFELFPTSRDTAHVALILPSRQHSPDRSIRDELSFILKESHYSEKIIGDPICNEYFGIVPVGRIRQSALDRIVFFGEAGQTNPAASATGLSRMLHTYRSLAAGIEECLRYDKLRKNDLLRAMPQYMTSMNRIFQEYLFESLLSFSCDDFRRLVVEINEYPDYVVNDLVFAEFDFRSGKTLQFALDAFLRPHSVLGRQMARSIVRYLSCKWLF